MQATAIYRGFLLFAATSITSVAWGAASPADEANGNSASSDNEVLSEIVITGTKLGVADLSKAAVAGVSLNADDIARGAIRSTADLQSMVPGLVVNQAGNFSDAFIRGTGSTFSTAGVEAAVATYVDGVYIQRQNGTILDLVDIKTVDVLKGPQGTLYGRNATGGAIVIDTADPTFDRFGGYVKGEYGHLSQSLAEGVLNIPITDTFAVRLAAQRRSIGDYREVWTTGPTGQKTGHSSNWTWRLKALWKPIDALSLQYTVEQSRVLSHQFQQTAQLGAPYCLTCVLFGPIPIPTGPDNFYSSTETPGLFQNNAYLQQILTVTYKTDDFTVSSTTGARNQHENMTNEEDSTYIPFFYAGIKETGPTITNDTFIRTTLQSPLNGLVGVSYMRDHDTQILVGGGLLFDGAFGAPNTVAHGTNDDTIDSESVYGELTYAFPEDYKLTVGGRYNRDKKEIAVTNDPVALAIFAGGDPASQAFTQRKTWNGVTPRIVFSRAIGDGYYYASWNRGLKSGAYPSPLNSISAQPADQETLDMYELGAKNGFLDNRIHTTAAVFYGKYKNIQVQTVNATSGSVELQNAATAKIKGVELTADVQLIKDFRVSGGLSYLDAKFGSFPDAAIFCPEPGGAPGLANCTIDLSGKRVPHAPEFSGFAGTEYTYHLPNSWGARLAVNAHFTTSFDFAADAAGPLASDRQGGYTLANANLTLLSPSENTEIGGYVDNMFEKHYYDFKQTYAFGAYGTTALPRTYGVRVTQRF